MPATSLISRGARLMLLVMTVTRPRSRGLARLCCVDMADVRLHLRFSVTASIAGKKVAMNAWVVGALVGFLEGGKRIRSIGDKNAKGTLLFLWDAANREGSLGNGNA
jgi:hypothetical protein